VIRTFSGRHGVVGSDGFLLVGIIAGDGSSTPRLDGVDSVALRDLVAIGHRVTPRRVEPTSQAITSYRAIVERIFRERAIVPAPFGTVFRSHAALTRWLELHYVSLREALGWVNERAVARLIMSATADTATPDYEAAVFESMKFLRRHAVASITLPDESDGKPRTAELSFLVDRERWSAFSDAVRDEQERVAGVTIQQSGPWPAYDFVRLQFGS
jgi:hypothetical protein